MRSWALANDWSYEFLDDRFFSPAPDWVRERCAGNIYAITDVCRLHWIRSSLDDGFERVIWADADILMFDSSQIDVPTPRGHAFAHEIFLRMNADGSFSPVEGMNNSLMVFERDQEVLDVYLARCFERLRATSSGGVARTALGPLLLRELDAQYRLDRLFGVGLFTLALMRELADGGGNLADELARRSPARLGAENLCTSCVTPLHPATGRVSTCSTRSR